MSRKKSLLSSDSEDNRQAKVIHYNGHYVVQPNSSINYSGSSRHARAVPRQIKIVDKRQPHHCSTNYQAPSVEDCSDDDDDRVQSASGSSGSIDVLIDDLEEATMSSTTAEVGKSTPAQHTSSISSQARTDAVNHSTGNSGKPSPTRPKRSFSYAPDSRHRERGRRSVSEDSLGSREQHILDNSRNPFLQFQQNGDQERRPRGILRNSSRDRSGGRYPISGSRSRSRSRSVSRPQTRRVSFGSGTKPPAHTKYHSDQDVHYGAREREFRHRNRDSAEQSESRRRSASAQSLSTRSRGSYWRDTGEQIVKALSYYVSNTGVSNERTSRKRSSHDSQYQSESARNERRHRGSSETDYLQSVCATGRPEHHSYVQHQSLPTGEFDTRIFRDAIQREGTYQAVDPGSRSMRSMPQHHHSQPIGKDVRYKVEKSSKAQPNIKRKEFHFSGMPQDEESRAHARANGVERWQLYWDKDSSKNKKQNDRNKSRSVHEDRTTQSKPHPRLQSPSSYDDEDALLHYAADVAYQDWRLMEILVQYRFKGMDLTRILQDFDETYPELRHRVTYSFDDKGESSRSPRPHPWLAAVMDAFIQYQKAYPRQLNANHRTARKILDKRLFGKHLSCDTILSWLEQSPRFVVECQIIELRGMEGLRLVTSNDPGLRTFLMALATAVHQNRHLVAVDQFVPGCAHVWDTEESERVWRRWRHWE